MFNLSRQCVICWKKITTLLKMDDQLIISVDPYWIWYKRRLTIAINFFKIVKFLWCIVRVWKRFSLPSNRTRGVFLDKTTFLDSDGFVFSVFSLFSLHSNVAHQSNLVQYSFMGKPFFAVNNIYLKPVYTLLMQ